MIIYKPGEEEQLISNLQKVEGERYFEILWVDDKIYGKGGWNRYFVNYIRYGEKMYKDYEENEVLFSAFHSDEKDIEKAKAAGFTIFY
jgi:hypothetical protein